jgi:hypothetical protein
VIDRDEVRREPIRVDGLRVQGDEKSEDLLVTSPARDEGRTITGLILRRVRKLW